MDKEMKETISRCARIIRETGSGEVIINTCGATLRYQVENCGRTRYFGTLEELESFAENRLQHRNSHLRTASSHRKRYTSRTQCYSL